MVKRKRNGSTVEVVDNTEIVGDEDLLVFARETLTRQLVKSSARLYPKLKIANGDIMPIVVLDGYEWENQIDVFEFDMVGIATVLAGAANDGGKVGVIARKMSYQIKTISAYTEVPWLTIRQSQAKGMDLPRRFTDALKMGIDKKINLVGYFGDTDYGLQGLFTSPLPRLNAATTLANAPSPDAMLAILNGMVSSVVQNNNGLWLPKTLVMPLAQQQLIANTYRATNSDVTVYDAFLESQRKLDQIEEIIVDQTLKGQGELGTDAMLVLPGNQVPSEEVMEGLQEGFDDQTDHPIYFALPSDMEIPDEFQQWVDTFYRERAVARIGGTIVAEPFSGAIVSGV